MFKKSQSQISLSSSESWLGPISSRGSLFNTHVPCRLVVVFCWLPWLPFSSRVLLPQQKVNPLTRLCYQPSSYKGNCAACVVRPTITSTTRFLYCLLAFYHLVTTDRGYPIHWPVTGHFHHSPFGLLPVAPFVPPYNMLYS